MGSNWDWVRRTQSVSSRGSTLQAPVRERPSSASAAATAAGMSASAGNRAETTLLGHSPGGASPGSPNRGVSAAVPASAPSMPTERAPSSISRSPSRSALASSARIRSVCQTMAGAPRGYFPLRSFFSSSSLCSR